VGQELSKLFPREKNLLRPKKTEDLSNLKPKPDLLAPRNEVEQDDNIYHPRKFPPTAMDDKTSKQERDAARKEKHFLRQATGDSYMKDVLDDLEDRPEEVREFFGESREQSKYMAQRERQEKVEEDLFIRANRTKEDKKREKRLKSRSGLDGLTETFDDAFKFLDKDDDSGSGRNRGGGGFKRRKRRH
jgi:U3 small nucleolar ribonucleoprotein protein LCP5